MYLQTGKKHSWLPDISFLIWNKPRSSPTCLLEEVLVQTPLRGHLCRVVVWADPELEVTHVVGRQLHPHLDGLTTDVPPDKNALSIHPTSFIVTRLKKNHSVLSHQRFCNFVILLLYPHLSKGPSYLKQKCTQLTTPFLGTVFNALSLGVIHFVRSVSLRNHFLVGWNSLTANQKLQF